MPQSKALDPMSVENPRHRLEPVLASRAFRHWTTRAVIVAAGELGASGIEWSESHLDPANIRATIDLRNETFDHGLTVSGLAAGGLPDWASFDEIVDAAVVLKAPTIRLSPAALVCGFDLGSPCFGKVSELSRALDVALMAGVSVSLAYRPAEFDSALRIVRRIAHPGLRLYWRSSSLWPNEPENCRLAGLRFYIPNIRVEEFVSADGSRVSDKIARRSIFADAGEPRFAVFDAAPGGASLPRLVKESVSFRHGSVVRSPNRRAAWII